MRIAGVVLALTLATGAPALDLYRVAGTVINAQTRAPMARAHVVIIQSEVMTPLASIVAGDDGKFRFDLPEGSYSLLAGSRDSMQSYGTRVLGAGFGSAVIAGPGKDTGTLTFLYNQGGSIVGRVSDAYGEPVEGARVQLVRSGVSAGRRINTTFLWDRTDDRGQYRFGQIPSDQDYYLAVTGEPWFAKRNSRGIGSNENQNAAYVPAFYPGTRGVDRAAPIRVRGGEEVRADFTLTSTVNANVDVKFDWGTEGLTQGATGRVVLLAEGIASTDSVQQNQWLQTYSNPQRLTAVPPGRYTVRVTVSGGGKELEGSAPVDVNGNDVSVKVAVRPAATVSGAVQMERPSLKPHGSVLVALAHEKSGGSTVTVKPDRSFAFPRLSAGKYRISVRGTDGLFASRIEVKGADYTNGLLNVTSGAAITVALVVSDQTGNFKGVVVRGERPVPGAIVVLVPRRDGGVGRGFQTESDGSFDFKNLEAGDYSAFAVEDRDIEYAKPGALDTWLPGAKTVKVAAHATTTENIVLTDVKP
jgi:hypothetical protein